MARKGSSKSKTRNLPKIFDKCPFCEDGKNPSHKDYEHLAKFLTDRAKILGSKRSGVCSRHQRLLTREIKRARYLGLLPYKQEI